MSAPLFVPYSERYVPPLSAEEEEREFYEKRAPSEWLEALAPLGTDANKEFLETAPWLIAVFRLVPKKVVGTDVFHAAILLWAAGIAHWIGGNVDFGLAGTILLGSVPGVVIGAALSARAPQGVLRTALGLVLVGSGIVTVQKGDPTLWPIAAVVAAVGLSLIIYAPRWYAKRRARDAGGKPDLPVEAIG